MIKWKYEITINDWKYSKLELIKDGVFKTAPRIAVKNPQIYNPNYFNIRHNLNYFSVAIKRWPKWVNMAYGGQLCVLCTIFHCPLILLVK